jgi:hypothetical protein
MSWLKKHIPAAWQLRYRLKKQNTGKIKCVVIGAFWQVLLRAYLLAEDKT